MSATRLSSKLGVIVTSPGMGEVLRTGRKVKDGLKPVNRGCAFAEQIKPFAGEQSRVWLRSLAQIFGVMKCLV